MVPVQDAAAVPLIQILVEFATNVVPVAAVSLVLGVYVWFVSQLVVIASGEAVGVPITVGV